MMKKSNQRLIASVLFLCVMFFAREVTADLCNDTDTEDCATCCKGDTGSKTCITDILKCPLNPNPDFSVLVTILIILGAFIVGIPVLLLIIDKLLCGNLLSCKMSLCECIANYICCCFCLSQEKKPVEYEDLEDNDVIDVKKKPTNKIAPESK